MRVPYEWLIVATLCVGQLAHAQNWGPAPADPYGYGGYPAPSPLYAELLPADRALTFPEDFSSRGLLDTREMFRGTWASIEYLHGNISHNDSRVLGTPVILQDPFDPDLTTYVADPSKQFEIVMQDGISTALVQVPTTRGVQWKNAQGVRGSFGVPVAKAFWIEGRIWQFEDQEAHLDVPYFAPTSQPKEGGGGLNTNMLATTVTVDGQVVGFGALYDASFEGTYTNTVKAGDIALVFNWKAPDEGLRLQPILGYRHEEYGETLGFGGTFDNRSGYFPDIGTIAPQSNWIQSRTRNQRDMMELGLRSEIRRGFLTLGVQERISFGSNIARVTVDTTNALIPGTPPGVVVGPEETSATLRETTFAPSFDLDAYVHVQVNRWLKLRVGYNLIWMGGVAAADQSIRFNAVSNEFNELTSDIGPRLRYSDRTVSSLTIGGEILLP